MKIILRKEAKELGLIKYFTGEPCKHGHVAERYTKHGTCLGCAANERKENGAARKRKYYKQNKDKILQQNKEWNNKNNYHEKHRKKNKEYYAKLAREYYKNNKEKHSQRIKNWYMNNKGKVTAQAAKRRQNVRDATPPWVDLRAIEKIYIECQRITEETGTEHHVDHIIPLCGKNVSGLHIPENLQILPKSENLSKGNKLLKEHRCG